MKRKNHLEQLRRYREQSRSLKRGALPTAQQPKNQPVKKREVAWDYAFGMTLFGFAFGAILGFIHQHTFSSVACGAILWAIIALAGFSLWPLVPLITQAWRERGWPNPALLKELPAGHGAFCLATLSAIMAKFSLPVVLYFFPLSVLSNSPAALSSAHPLGANNSYFYMFAQNVNIHLPAFSGDAFLEMAKTFGIVWLVWMGIGLILVALWHWGYRQVNRSTGLMGSHDDQDKDAFRLWLGKSTGRLAQLGHSTPLAPQQHVSLTLEDAAQNILILGGIGSGKTTRVVHPLLLQLLDQRCGGLIFDVKGDFYHAVRQFSQDTGQPVITLGPGHTPLNLLAGLTPEMAASFLKSVLLLADPHPGSSFWIESATELCRNSLGLLSFVPHHYSLKGLYRYVFNTSFQAEIADVLETKRPHLTEEERGTLEAFEEYQRDLYDRLDEKVKAGMFATLAQVLSPFNQPALTKAFCTATPDAQGLAAVLTGSVFLVNLPLATWGLGAKVVYTLIKLRFYNLMQQRTRQAPSSALHPVFFLCDEFQEIVSANKDGLSDLNFWDKSRSSKTIGIVSAQAISSFYAALGNRDLADALCQNFRQKLCFRTEDLNTLQYFQTLADKVEVSRRTFGESSGTQEQGGRGSNSSRSKTESTSWTEKQVLNAQIFRQLSPDQAIALLSIGGQSADDILDVMPVYVTPSEVSEAGALATA